MTKKSQLLVEYFPIEYNASLLNEAIKNNGTLRIPAVLQIAEDKNQNGRVYPRPILERESQKYVDNFVNQRRALGELDHPESRTVVNLANVSHNIVEMHWEGNVLKGVIEILSTPAGNIVKELIKAGIRMGMSSRGVGSVKPMGESTVEVDEDYALICFDIVSNPSTMGAFIGESVERSLSQNRSKRINELVGDFFSEINGK